MALCRFRLFLSDMKQILLPAGLFLTLLTAAQPPKKSKTPVKPAPKSALRNLKDSASYAIGVSIATFYNEQGLTGLNPAAIAQAVSDVQGRKKTALTEYEANTILLDYMNRIQEAKAKPNKEAGERFLLENRKKAGVKITSTGLQYEVLVEGTGPRPTATDTVVTHYAGTLIDGTEFDNSYKRGEPITIPVSGVIKGWTEALQLMPVGSKYRLYIPQELGYGIHESGAIPGGSVLLFDVELVRIVGK
jgi:FKBP-type peptidyl-prolyl cis-trans isomerase